MPQSQKGFDRTVNKKCLVGEDHYCFEKQLNCCEVRNVRDDGDDDDYGGGGNDDDDDDNNNNNNKCVLLACGKQTGLMLSLKVTGLVSLRSAISWFPVRAS
jgi:hypothetical protein